MIFVPWTYSSYRGIVLVWAKGVVKSNNTKRTRTHNSENIGVTGSRKSAYFVMWKLNRNIYDILRCIAFGIFTRFFPQEIYAVRPWRHKSNEHVTLDSSVNTWRVINDCSTLNSCQASLLLVLIIYLCADVSIFYRINLDEIIDEVCENKGLNLFVR